MRKWKRLFATPQNSNETYYDLFDDWDLIDASITQQYGIRMRYEPDMSWGEFCTLLSGINGDTPLGQVVDIRSTTDKERIKNMTSHQKKIRSDWQSKQAKKGINMDAYMQSMKSLEEVMKSLAS